MRSYFRHLYLDVLLGGAQLTLLAVGIVLPIPPVWRTCLSLIAAISLIAWIGVYRRLRRIEDTPTSSIASAAQGYVELSGRCRTPEGAPMLAPYSQMDCVWCRYAMDEYKGRSWYRVEQGETDASFVLADSSGSCMVDPAGAEIITNNKQTWTQDNYRYTEWKILQNSRLYVLGEFRTETQQPSSADLDSDVSALLTEWKRDHAALLARFDRNRDGTIDLDEWEQVRLAARADVEKNYREMQAAPALSVVRAPKDGRQYLISNESQSELRRMYQLRVWLHLAVFIAAMAGLGRSLFA